MAPKVGQAASGGYTYRLDDLQITSKSPVKVQAQNPSLFGGIFGEKRSILISGMNGGTIQSLNQKRPTNVVIENSKNFKFSGSKNAPNSVELHDCKNPVIELGDEPDHVCAHRNVTNPRINLGWESTDNCRDGGHY